MSPLIAKAHTISTVLIWQLNGALGAIFRAEICFDSDLLSSSSSSGGEMARIQKLLLLLLAWNSCTVAFLCIQHPLHTGTKLLKNVVNLFKLLCAHLHPEVKWRASKNFLFFLLGTPALWGFYFYNTPYTLGPNSWKMLSIFSNFYVLIFIWRLNCAHPKISSSSCLELLHYGVFKNTTPLTQ